jgi:hypothetical protein
MTIKQKFLWKEGEIRFYRRKYVISDEQYQRADKALDEVISQMKVRSRRPSAIMRGVRGRSYYRSRRQIKKPLVA